MGYYRIYILLILLLNGYSRGETPCSEIARQNNIQGCLDAIYSLAKNDTYFWFGVGYDTRCPVGTDDPDMCPIWSTETTLAGKLFTTFTNTTLSQYLNVRFLSPPGVYEGCGNSYTITETKEFTIDALDAKPVNAWDTRIIPTLDWTVTTGAYYTLIMVDVGLEFIHALFVNIQSPDLANVDIVSSYFGPGNPRSTPTPYAFILYQQSGRITVAQNWYKQLEATRLMDINQFTTTYLLNDPVALNWVIVAADPYSVGRLYDVYRLQNNCPTVIAKEFPKQQLSFVPVDTRFTVNLDVTYHSPALEFQSCCSQYVYDAVNMSLNPLGDGQVTPGQSRFEPTVELLKNNFLPNNTRDFAGKLLTLLFVDADVATPSIGTRDLPLLQWAVMNIEEGVVETGTIVIDYKIFYSPEGVHKKYFLVYEHTQPLDAATVKKYAGACASGLEGQCMYNITAFASENSLQLIGVSWMASAADEYARLQLIKQGTADEVCKHVHGYIKGCGTASCSGNLKISLVLIVISMILCKIRQI